MKIKNNRLAGRNISMDPQHKLESRYKSIVELAPDVVYTISKTGTLTSLSSAFERITGWKRKEWLGKNFAALIHPLDLPDALLNFKKTLSGEVLTHYRLRIKTKNDAYILGEFKSAPDMIDGKIVGVIGIGRDITNSEREQRQLVHYRNLVSSADSAIISRDLKGNIITWNSAAEKLFGYKAKEIIGQNFSILVPNELKDEIKKINQKVKDGKPIEYYETVRVKKNGEKFHVLAKISPIFNDKGRIVGASLFDRDNSKIKKQEEAQVFITRASKILSSSLDFKKTISKVAQILVPDLADWSSVHIIDEKGELTQLTVAHKDPKKVKWALALQEKYKNEPKDKNNATARVVRSGKSELYPYVTDELIKKSVKKEEDRKLLFKLKLKSILIVPLIVGKKTLGAMTLVSTRNSKHYDQGDLKFAEELGKMAGQAIENAKLYFDAENEIAKRKIVEQHLRESRDELKIILENIGDGITVQDNKGKLIYANEAAALSSGYKSVKDMLENPGKWVGKFELKGENGEPINIENFPGRRALRGELSPSLTINYTNNATGEIRWSHIKASPIFDENGKVKAVVNIINDITERKELERKKDDFISIASHELKTPVTSIKGFTHLLKREHTAYSGTKSFMYINKIDNQLKNLTELINDLLDISRIQSGKLVYQEEEFEISSLVRDVVEDFSATSESHKIVFKNGTKQKVKGDKDRIMQVLINLITNAIKYSPKSNKILVYVKPKGGKIEVGVKDYGIGIDKDEMNKIFERFYRVKDPRGKTFPGLGIGLHISKEIALRHNGDIKVESRKGKGSVFKFIIPTASHAKESKN